MWGIAARALFIVCSCLPILSSVASGSCPNFSNTTKASVRTLIVLSATTCLVMVLSFAIAGSSPCSSMYSQTCFCMSSFRMIDSSTVNQTCRTRRRRHPPHRRLENGWSRSCPHLERRYPEGRPQLSRVITKANNVAQASRLQPRPTDE